MNLHTRLRGGVHHSRRGSVLPLVTILLIFLLGMVSFAIDVGLVAQSRTELQRSADSGALAGVARLPTLPGQTQLTSAAASELRTFVNYNQTLTVLDADIVLGKYDPTLAAGSQWTTNLNGSAANGIQVTVRKDSSANGQLGLVFGQVIGQSTANVQASATAYLPTAYGVKSGPDLLPYTIQIDYYRAALGLAPITGEELNRSALVDNYTVNTTTGTVTTGTDGKSEIILFGSGQNTPGNFGSVDIGSASNGTPELVRQIVYGPNASDFSNSDFASKVSADGALYAPNSFGGDTGISGGVESAFQSIIGQNRIVPLYDTVSGNGNNAAYHIVGFGAGTVVAVDLHGNPKQIWFQPKAFFTKGVTANAGASGAVPMTGVYGAPKLVIP